MLRRVPIRRFAAYHGPYSVNTPAKPWWRWALWVVAGSTASIAFLNSDSPYKAYIASFWRRSPYPPSVQAHLRAALSAEHGLLGSGTLNGDADPLATAEAHYINALKQCAQLHLAPEEDAVTGIQIQYAALKEKQAAYTASVAILKEVFTVIEASLPRLKTIEERQAKAQKLVGIAQKMGDLYVRLKEWEEAEAYYVWGMESLLMLTKRKHGLPAGARPGMQLLQAENVPLSPLLNALAMLYRAQKKHAAAAHLFQFEFDLVKDLYPGRAMIIACNVAESLTAEQHLKEAKTWLDKAESLLTKTGPTKNWVFFSNTRPDEDDAARKEAECILYNSRGKVAEMEGEKAKAALCYTKSLTLSKKHQFIACAVESERNLKQLEATMGPEENKAQKTK